MREFLILFLVLFVPVSTSEVYDISGDGTHLIKVVYQDGNFTVFIDDESFTVQEYIYSIDGNGTHLIASSEQMIYFYTYEGELISEIQSSVWIYRLAVEGSKIYFITYMNNSRRIAEDPVEPKYLTKADLEELWDLEAYKGKLYFIGGTEEGTAIYEFADGKTTKLASVNASYLAIINGELKAYDADGHEVWSKKLEGGMMVPLPEPKPMEEITEPEAATTATAASAGILAYLYLIRERRLSSLASLRRLIKKRYTKDLALLIPIAGRIIELVVMPYKDPLSLLVLTSLSISGGYGVYSLITRNFRRRFKAISIILSIYAAVSSFYASMLFTRRYTVIIFYALTILYSRFALKLE